MPLEIQKLKQVGRKVKYAGGQKVTLEQIINLLKQKAYCRSELQETLGLSSTRVQYYIKELEKTGKLRKAMYSRKVYYWYEDDKK